MERPVKERLIGAAVLMAAAIILIPEMLSGPDRESAEEQAQTAPVSEGGGEAAIKTYTIDLNKAPGSQPPMPVEQVDNRAPPSEEALPPESPPEQSAPEPTAQAPIVAQASPESSAQAIPAAAAAPTQESPKPAPKPEPKPETPKPEPKPESPKPEPRAVASTPSAPRSAVPTGKGWAVQLASYSSEATAERVMKEWRGKGQSAFVMPVTTGGKTLYRVRIGPTKDRAGAEAVLKVVKTSIPGAAVVTHP